MIACIQADIDLMVPHKATFTHNPALVLCIVTRLEHHLRAAGELHQSQTKIIVLDFATFREGPFLIAARIVTGEEACRGGMSKEGKERTVMI